LANTENNVGPGPLCQQACLLLLYSKQDAYLNDKHDC